MSRVICVRCGSVAPWSERNGERLIDKRCQNPACWGRVENYRRSPCSRCGRATVFGPQRPEGMGSRKGYMGGVGLKIYTGVLVPWIDGSRDGTRDAKGNETDPALARYPEPPTSRSAALANAFADPSARPLIPAEQIAERIRSSGAVVTVADVCDVSDAVVRERYKNANWTNNQHLLVMLWCSDLLRSSVYGSQPALSFGPNALRAVRRILVEHSRPDGKPMSRTEVTRRVGIFRRMFKVAASFELIPISVHEALGSVESLRPGESRAREMPHVVPVPSEVFEATLACVSPTIRAMMLVQFHTGMRTGELVTMKVGEIDRSSSTWIYRPARHKNSHRGHSRAIPFGPLAREALLPLLEPALELGLEDYLFSPKRAMESFHKKRRAARKTPNWPSHVTNRKRKPSSEILRGPGECYTTQSFARAVSKVAATANLPHWRPYQLRHGHLTRVRDECGIEAAQAVGGHKNVKMTEHYAAASLKRACELAEKLG